MKSNDELIKEFESRRNLSLEEWQELMKKQSLSDDTEIQIMEVDDLFEYMHSLGYSTLDEIKGKYGI